MRKGLLVSSKFTGDSGSTRGGGCAGHPKGIKPLTDSEKDRLIQVALYTPEVSKWLEGQTIYKAEVSWVAIDWRNSKAVGWARLDYEEIADGNPPENFS